jgi:hypothetical protein
MAFTIDLNTRGQYFHHMFESGQYLLLSLKARILFPEFSISLYDNRKSDSLLGLIVDHKLLIWHLHDNLYIVSDATKTAILFIPVRDVT